MSDNQSINLGNDNFVRSVIHRQVGKLIAKSDFTQQDRNDLVQEVYVRATKSLRLFDPSVGHPYPYVCTVVQRHLAILDKKNNSIHVHLYGSKFDDQQKPILVKQADSKFPECEDVELVRQVVEGELRSYELQIREIKVLKEDKILVEQFAHPHRIIVRFK